MTMLLAAILAAATPAPAAALPPADPQQADAQCMAALAAASTTGTTAAAAQGGQMGVIFFAGKLLGHAPDADLSALLASGTQGIADNSASEVRRCAGELGAAGQRLAEAGTALQRQAR